MQKAEHVALAARKYAEKGLEFERFFESQQLLAQTSSSILCVYDAEDPVSTANCKIIDVGGTMVFTGCRDDSFLKGAKSFVALWEGLVQRLSTDGNG
jgi:hypothetical protein